MSSSKYIHFRRLAKKKRGQYITYKIVWRDIWRDVITI